MSRVRSSLVGAVAACALLLVGAAGAAWADDPPPDLSMSTLSCFAENAVPPFAGSTRPGDFVLCQLKATVTGPTIAYHVTADISIPPGTSYAPLPNAQGIPLPADNPTKVFFDESKLGLINPGLTKPALVRLVVDDDAVPGDPIQPHATLRDPLAATEDEPANLLTVMPQKADLSKSTTTCANLDPARTDVRAGDTLDCRFLLKNEAGREDATDVELTAGIPSGTAWAPGGNEDYHFGNYLNWLSGISPRVVPSGQIADPLNMHLKISPDLPGGTLIYVNGIVNWTNALSGTTDSTGVGAKAVTITPGPAVLTSSTLACTDDDGPPLLAQDLINCTVNVRPAAGHEDLADTLTSAAVPALTGAVTPADGSGRIPLVGAYGTIPAGTIRTATYRLRVAADATYGNVIVPTALVTGRSTPSSTAISQPLLGNTLVIGVRGAAAPAPVAAAVPGAVAAAGTPAAAAHTPVICGSRRVVTVNVRPPKGKHWKSVTFSFSTKSVKGKKATGSRGKKGYYSARLVFQGLPQGPLKVAIKGVTTKGKTVKQSRTYNLCTKKK
jgi:hypothetical protein